MIPVSENSQNSRHLNPTPCLVPVPKQEKAEVPDQLPLQIQRNVVLFPPLDRLRTDSWERKGGESRGGVE